MFKIFHYEKNFGAGRMTQSVRLRSEMLCALVEFLDKHDLNVAPTDIDARSGDNFLVEAANGDWLMVTEI